MWAQHPKAKLVSQPFEGYLKCLQIPFWGCSLNVFAIVIVFLIVFLLVRSCFLITLNKCLKGHKSLGLLLGGVLKMYLSLSLSSSFSLSLSLSFFGSGHVSSDHSNQMSQRSQVSRIALWGCSLNVFVIVYVFVIVFVLVFLLVRSCFLITLIKCLKGRKSLGSLCNVKSKS